MTPMGVDTTLEPSAKKVSTRPEVTIIAGPNGTGKTTFALEYLHTHPQRYLSADAIADELGPGEPKEIRIQAGRRFFETLTDLVSSSQSFVMESTLSGQGFSRALGRFKEARYSVVIVFIFLDSAEACVARVKGRARRRVGPIIVFSYTLGPGGHGETASCCRFRSPATRPRRTITG